MKQIGRYIIRGLLGRGGMGKVYKVELPPIGKIAALKYFVPDPLLAKLMGYDKLRDLFISEARTIASLNHPNIVQIHDFHEIDGKPFYVMDYYADNLGTMIGESYIIEEQSRKIPPDKALAYIHQTLKGLACLHEAGIIHRDIKPFNLLIDANDNIRICDFGLSKLRGETYSGPSNLNVGSPYYAAPEQEENPNNVDSTADLYPLGIMLYRMLTGRLPEYPADSKDYLPVGRQHPDLDEAWDAFLSHAMARASAKRYRNAEQMLSELQNLERHWEAVKENACRLPLQQASLRHGDRHSFTSPREHAIKTGAKGARSKFELDELWRPLNYHQNVFIHTSNDTVLDKTTGKLWQKSGSIAPFNWRRAQNYIDHLNENRFAGKTTWRLPTIAELITLLRPVLQAQDMCIESFFNPDQKKLWSIDRRSFTSAYYVDAEMGFVGWQDCSAHYHIRAVCSQDHH